LSPRAIWGMGGKRRQMAEVGDVQGLLACVLEVRRFAPTPPFRAFGHGLGTAGSRRDERSSDSRFARAPVARGGTGRAVEPRPAERPAGTRKEAERWHSRSSIRGTGYDSPRGFPGSGPRPAPHRSAKAARRPPVSATARWRARASASTRATAPRSPRRRASAPAVASADQRPERRGAAAAQRRVGFGGDARVGGNGQDSDVGVFGSAGTRPACWSSFARHGRRGRGERSPC
jgi:hypothetical protein